MTERADPAAADPRAYWKNRSAGWSATSPSALPTDDTFDRAIIQAARIGQGDDVLDVAAGTGDPSISIARAVGPAGSVVACDLTPEMLTVARARAAALSLDNWHAAAGDMTALPFPANSFDAVTCRMGLMFPADRLACAAEALRVLEPRGRAAYLVWGTLEENSVFLMVQAGLRAYFGEEPPLRRQRNALGAPGLVSAVLEMAGFDGVEERVVAYERVAEPGGDYFRRAAQRTDPRRFAALSEAEATALVAALERACADLRDGGVYHIPTVARLGIGRKRA